MSDIQNDWELAAVEWVRAGCVYGAFVGPTGRTREVYSLCQSFVGAHPEAKGFLLGKLLDPDPYVAAYACKCLAMLDDIAVADIPVSALGRADVVSVQPSGCVVRSSRLGRYFRFELGLDKELVEEPIDEVAIEPRRLRPDRFPE